MSRLKTCIAPAAGLVVGTLALTTPVPWNAAAAPAPIPAAPVADVNIVSPLPLPVAGSSTVSGTVAATQSGAWNIAVNNPTTSPVPVRDVDSAGRQPFQLRVDASFGSSNVAQDQVTNNTGKRFVVEFVAVHGQVRSPETLESAACSSATFPDDVYLKPMFMRPDPFGGSFLNHGASQLVKFSIEPGGLFACTFTRTGGSDASSNAHAAAFGYLVSP